MFGFFLVEFQGHIDKETDDKKHSQKLGFSVNLLSFECSHQNIHEKSYQNCAQLVFGVAVGADKSRELCFSAVRVW